MSFVMRGLATMLTALAIVVAPRIACAIDFYEIQIYPTETDPQYHLQVELHSNSTTTSAGAEAKEQIDPHQIHETIETTYGLLPYLEVGQYFCTAKLDDGHYEYAGSRSKLHFGIPQTMEWPVSFGGNLELDYMRRAAEDQPFTLEMRPIAETHFGKFTLVANLPFEKPFAGPGTHKGVTISPQGLIEYEKLLGWLSPAVEYYGDMGAIRSLPGVQHQQHFIVPALNFDFLDQLELNVGVGIGLTRASNGTFVKTIVGWTF
ncbi:MAG TPA: hypothetical protein VN865_09485 [Candidatus Acidoferrales bacterium]|nr:hypothetical protein [Candidatus Acidoferrales bacterium]